MMSQMLHFFHNGISEHCSGTHCTEAGHEFDHLLTHGDSLRDSDILDAIPVNLATLQSGISMPVV